MAITALGSKAVGSVVTLKENGAAVNYLVVHQGLPDASMYDASCNGTWLLRKDIAEDKVWSALGWNTYKESDIFNYLNNTWINRYETNIKNSIKQVKIPYVNGTGDRGNVASGANGLSCKVFLLSGREAAFNTFDDSEYFPEDGMDLDFLRE